MREDKVLYTGGTFDLFHAGHVTFLRHCRNIADRVVVGLNTDEFIEQFKGKKPVISYFERREVLLACKYVDEVMPNVGGEDSKPAILMAQANIIAIGVDWAYKDYYVQMGFTQEWLERQKITLVYVAIDKNQSSTNIKEKIGT